VSEKLNFKISAGLKNIIGRELITDKYIAIFELVKNSYDAHASEVLITFENLGKSNARIIISDNGIGMDKKDIINKWLFVAYSEKNNPSYRDSIGNRKYAGAKGIGRFSCDRLGSNVELISTVINSKEQHIIKINWDDFEKDSKEDFASIGINYDLQSIAEDQQGTTVIVTNLRESWDRKSLLDLKKALTQLVNPSATETYDKFNVIISVKEELEQDENEKEERNRVNGAIRNYVFESLNIKTTKIYVSIAEDGKTIETILTDRGTHLFSMIEKNEYTLKGISCTLYNLNRSAKINFKRIMGVDSVNYGSVFIYKNGFRVFPYGVPEQDFFKINQRKAQGHSRYLGTRELIGQINIDGDKNEFVETSSRNHGFIESNQYHELEDFFYEYVLKPLEKYVVNIINWANTDDLLHDDVLQNDNKNFDNLIKKLKPHTMENNIIDIDFNQHLMEIIEKRKNAVLSKAAQELRDIAIRRNDDELFKAANTVEKETNNLRSLVNDISSEKDIAQQQLDSTSGELAVTKKQVEILKNRADLTADEALSAMHIMKGYADAIDSIVDELYECLNELSVDNSEVGDLLGELNRTSRKIKNSYELVLNTQYSASTDIAHSNIVSFCKKYSEVVTGYNVNLNIIDSNSLNTNVKYNPLEFSIILDNLLSNSQKANATCLSISFKEVGEFIEIHFTDDGVGLSRSVLTPERIFEPGYSTTRGTGIGLQTVKKYIAKINGSISYNSNYEDGFELIAKVKV
jgi:signal transduction histidine kinase